ncbi:MAG TPA: alkaline phosphatase family protein [Xanthomonadaceae bacterium]|nr:alkaline phosphatase family protein [Xanthomonadaceae bacterium]
MLQRRIVISGLFATLALCLSTDVLASAASVPATPIRHLVVIFQENVSFDHYFATYPRAANPPGEPAFHAASDTPSVNGLTGSLLTGNPNRLNPQNGIGAIDPFRLDRSQAATADQDHDYGPEQSAFHAGLMDRFPMSVGNGGATGGGKGEPTTTTGLVMGYYDGNTVTALWNYAQHFAMSDNSYGTTFGPSAVGALNLVSGQTNGIVASAALPHDYVADDGNGGQTLIDDPDPLHDACSKGAQVAMGGRNIGDLLNESGVTWGWFQGGFDLSVVDANGTSGCKRSSPSVVTGKPKGDYIPHHEPFQFYASTANPTHARPASVAAIGHSGDPANHQYDLEDFYRAVRAGNMPAVSFLKASGSQNGHAGYSTPLDEQAFLVHVLNFLQERPEWRDTAVVIAWDDSDGWYDHQMPPIMNQSSSSEDTLSGHSCGDGDTALAGIAASTRHAQGRCGYGPRLPLLVVSPWARRNFVDHTITDQTSIIRFVEDNWLHGQRIGQGSFDALANPLDNLFDFHAEWVERNSTRLILSETTGQPR